MAPPQAATRRDDRRQETVAQIKALARQQLSDGGPSVLSLRAVAREMRMASAAIYRYFDSQADLISALWLDALAALGDAVEAARNSPAAAGPIEQWWLIAHAIRRWGLDNRGDYGLVFGTPLPGFPHAATLSASPAGARFAGTVIDTYVAADKAGLIDLRACFVPDNFEPGDLGAFLLSVQDSGRPLHLSAVACNAIASILGFTSGEVFGNLPRMVTDPDSLFAAHVRTVMVGMGFNRDQVVGLQHLPTL